MTLIARINVDGRMLENSNDRVGAFVNGQVRGVAALLLWLRKTNTLPTSQFSPINKVKPLIFNCLMPQPTAPVRLK